MHYLFGSNNYQQCREFDENFNKDRISFPYLINNKITAKTGGKIKGVYLGWCNTIFIVENEKN